MAMSDAEIEATRFHLGYGNLDFGSYPYTADGFKELFRDVVAPNLTIGAETTATTSIAGGSAAIVTPVSMTGITVQSRLVIDVADAQETVVVGSVTGSNFSALFQLAHPSSGYPVCVSSGQTRLRQLLHQAEKAWQACLSQSVGGTAGIKQVDEIQFFQGFAVMKDRLTQYKAIVLNLGSLIRLEPEWASRGPSGQLEAY